MDTPEEAARAFLAAWQRRDWNRMNRAVQVRRRISKRCTPRRLKAIFGTKIVQSWNLVESGPMSAARFVEVNGQRVGVTPDAVEVRARVLYRFGSEMIRRILTINVVRENEEGQPPADGEASTWGVNETSALREAVDSGS